MARQRLSPSDRELLREKYFTQLPIVAAIFAVSQVSQENTLDMDEAAADAIELVEAVIDALAVPK